MTTQPDTKTTAEPPAGEPQFEHDCDGCRFLGSTMLATGSPVDVYTCRGDGPVGDPTWIARYGNEGDQYKSTLASLAIRDHFTPDDGSPAWHAREPFRMLMPEWLRLAYRQDGDNVPNASTKELAS